MAGEDQKLQQSVFQLKRVFNPEKPTIYANNAQISANQWDIQLNFSLVREVSPGEFASVDEALIIMTPEHALAFANGLQNTLRAYAEQQGRIREPQAPTIPNAKLDTEKQGKS